METKVDVPRRIVHNKEEELRTSETGATFAWIDLGAAIGIAGYGTWFPTWLIHSEHKRCTLALRDTRITNGGRMVDVSFVIEHKEKIPGKKFKRFTYDAEGFAALLSAYTEEVGKIKSAENNRVLAKVTECDAEGKWTFYVVGYICGKMFYSEDLEGAKRLSAKNCTIIAEGLSATDEMRVKRWIGWIREAYNELPRFRKQQFWLLAAQQRTLPGYDEQLQNVRKAIEETRAFLEHRIEIYENALNTFQPGRETNDLS